jgi:ferredoxin-NADP reductase/ferredoxin
MPKVVFEGQHYLSEANETVLDCLIRHGVSVDHSCKVGVCQTCLMVATAGEPTEASQKGLKDALKARNYFLPCSCVPQGDMTVARPDEQLISVETTVLSLDPLNEEVVRLRLARPADYGYFPGQFLNLHNDQNIARSYSLASLAMGDDFLELHIRRVAGGKVSEWVHRRLKAGDKVRISPASGDCFYVAGHPEQALLLIGTGTGLAPLYGILRDALRQGHSGPIHLYHGSSRVENLYLMDELQALSRRHDNVHYHPCASRGAVPAGVAAGRADAQALQEQGNLSGWRVYLCGRQEMVTATKKQAFLAGAALQDIYADPFIPSLD